MNHIHLNNSNILKLPNSTNNKTYSKPNMYSMYSKDEMMKYGLTYKFIGVTTPSGTLASFAELYIKPSVIEIYNVYTHPTVRGTGYATKLLNQIKILYPDVPLWLGVVPDETFALKIKLYARSGFTSEVRLTSKAPSGKKFNFNFIGMKYRPNKIQKGLINKTINKARVLSLAAPYKHKLHKARFHISASYINQIKSRISNRNNSKEYGGAIQFSYNGFRNSLFTFESENSVSRYMEGKGGPTVAHFSTGVPPTNINQRYLVTWHTHPEICYELSGACVGLPSSSDIIFFLTRYLNGSDTTGINLIFAREGMYIIRLKSKFMTAVEKERYTTGVAVPNMSELNKIIREYQSAQYRPNLNKNQIGQNNIISTFKQQLETIKTPSGISIFEINLIRYPSSGGISFDVMLHSRAINSAK